MKARSLALILGKTVSRWNEHNAPRLGAAIAFYTLLALAPLVILLVVFVSAIFGSQAAEGQLVRDAQIWVGAIGANTVRDLLISARKPVQGVAASALATFTLLLGASAVFNELRDCLNTMWDVKPHRTGLRRVLSQRVFSFVLVLAAGAVLVSSMFATTAVTLAGHFLGDVLPVPAWIIEAANFLFSFGILTTVFALIFRFVPDLQLPWSVIWTGAGVAAPLFVIGKTMLGLYLSWAGIGSPYGAAGSLVAITVWVYYTAQIFLLGAEFTFVWAEVKFPKELEKARNRFRPRPIIPQGMNRRPMPAAPEGGQPIRHGELRK